MKKLRLIDNLNQEEEEEKRTETFMPWISFEKFLKTRTILISGVIDKKMVDSVLKQLLILEADSNDPILTIVNSPGGDADAGFAIFDFIRFIKPRVYTLCAGLAASAGSLIMLAANKGDRLSLPNSRLLIHQPLGGVGGTAIDIQIQAEEFKKLKYKINKIISEETGQPFEKVEKDTDRDFWMSAQEAIDYGLIDKIIYSRQELESIMAHS